MGGGRFARRCLERHDAQFTAVGLLPLLPLLCELVEQGNGIGPQFICRGEVFLPGPAPIFGQAHAGMLGCGIEATPPGCPRRTVTDLIRAEDIEVPLLDPHVGFPAAQVERRCGWFKLRVYTGAALHAAGVKRPPRAPRSSEDQLGCDGCERRWASREDMPTLTA